MDTVRMLTGFGKYTRENGKWQSDWVVASLKELPTILG